MMQANELFDICCTLAAGQPSASARRRMHEVLTLCCAEGTRHYGGGFGNLFSQVDFLCKQCGLSVADMVAVQTMRRHGNQNDSLTASDFGYDLRALALFISAVFGEAIPQRLLTLLPSQNRPAPKMLHIDKRCVRCVVTEWDDRFIRATTSDGEVQVDYATTEGGRDFAYLKRMLRVGMQLNLLDCHVEGNTVTPMLVVVEPDFLLDISAVAACFTAYGHHPLLYTVARLKPRPNTQAILLGNFAGTALDEVISHPQASTASALRRSFREQALRFCSCEGFDSERFKRDAEEQVQNIRQAVKVLTLHQPSSMSRPAPRNPRFLLEPSFVCERLGLQGRVDLMSSDMTLLVEQKSGRNMKIERQSHDQHGMQLENHYVQLLLYYGVLHYNFGRTDKTTSTQLLYSHYPAQQGLLVVNYYRTLFREAIRLRNQIVATELLIAREGFARVLPLLSPAIIYKEVKPDGYFQRYVLPELAALAAQLAALSPLERAYYERMLTFVYREQVWQKLGGGMSQLHHSGGAGSDLWLMPLDEKRETGNIFTDLKIAELKKSAPDGGGYDIVALERSQTTDATENFRRGDMVYLYAYSGTPDVRESILYKGTLDRIDSTQLVVRLNDGQQDASVFCLAEGWAWAVEHGGSDLTISSSVRSVHQFICAQPERKALLLGQRPPVADSQAVLSRSYSAYYDPILLKAKQARDYFLLVGPPGTGKTSQALRFMVAEAMPGPVLLMAYTNRAVDEICDMLEGQRWPYLRIGNAASCDPRFHAHLPENFLELQAGLDHIRQQLQRVPIVVGTTATLQSRQDILQLKHFAVCMVDEASQILEPSIIGLLAHPHIDRFVLIGDYKQLPAVVQQDEREALVEEPCLREIGLTDCRQSLFERLIRWEQQCGRTQFVGVLSRQGRMHPDVAQFPCTHFYAAEQLSPVGLEHQKEPMLSYETAPCDELDQLLCRQRVVFIDAGRPAEANMSDKVSPAEARIVAQLLGRIVRFCGTHFDPQHTVGVIVPYRNQIAMIRKEIEKLGIAALQDVSIDTVERYQGSQRDVIIYSLTVSHRYQLEFLAANTFMESGHEIDRKLNVAMTRARRQLLMTGCSEVLCQNALFRELIEQYEVELPGLCCENEIEKKK